MQKDRLIIFGSAPCCEADLAKIPRPDYFDYMAVGIDSLGKYKGDLVWVATNHNEDIIRLKAAAPQAGLISYNKFPDVDFVVAPPNPTGSSALTAVMAAIKMGYEKIILCGCPLEGNAPEGNPYEAFRPGWEAYYGAISGKVKSMSGWTRELLGYPPADWLIPKITIASCWDGRDYYSPDYVNRMFSMCERNTTVPFEFVLYIGPDAEKRRFEIDPAIKIFQTGLPYWWSGMQIWQADSPGIKTSDILYMDLDQVVVGSLDDIIVYPADLAGMTDWPAWDCPPGKEKDICVTTTLIRKNAGAVVWDKYVEAGMPQWDPLVFPRGPLPMAAQGLMNEFLTPACLPPLWVCSYKLWVQKKGMPKDCRIVAFHGRPKQHEVGDAWVKEHWR